MIVLGVDWAMDKSKIEWLMGYGLRPKMADLLIAKYRVINHFVKWVSNNMATVFNSSTIDNSYG